MEYYSALKREENPVLGDKIEEPREYYAKRNESVTENKNCIIPFI